MHEKESVVYQQICYFLVDCVLISELYLDTPAICNGLITQTGACQSNRYIKRFNKIFQADGKCEKPEACNCRSADTAANYFYADGPFCKG